MMIRLLIAIALLAAGAARADNYKPGWYLYGGAGSVSSTDPRGEAANNAALAGQGFNVIASTDKSDSAALLLGAGYRFSRHFALEGGYADLSELHHYSGTFTVAPNAGNRSKRWNASGFEIAALGLLPVTRSIDVIGKAGIYSMKGEFTEATLVSAPNGSVVSSTSASSSGSGTVPVFGIGASIAMAEDIAVRAMLQSIKSKGGMFGVGNDLDSIRIFSLTVVLGL